MVKVFVSRNMSIILGYKNTIGMWLYYSLYVGVIVYWFYYEIQWSKLKARYYE